MNSFALSAASASLQFVQFCLKNEMTCKIIGWAQTIITGLIFILVFSWLIRYMIRNYKQEISFKRSIIYAVLVYLGFLGTGFILGILRIQSSLILIIAIICIGAAILFSAAKFFKDTLITLSFSFKAMITFFILNALIGMALSFILATLLGLFL